MLIILCIGCSNPNNEIERLKDLSTHELDSIRNGITASYKDTIKIDTSVILGKGDTIRVKFVQFCTYDNKISTPQEYLDVYNLPVFQTHNFISKVEFKINSKIIYNGFITKDDFKNQLSDEYKKYGVLKYSPDIDIVGKEISIEYGIGIPLSGTEWGYIMEIDSAGKKRVGSLD
jgi:hypothetical protein